MIGELARSFAAQGRRRESGGGSERERPARRKEPMSKEEFTFRLHLWMIGVSVGLIASSALAHFFQPNDRLWERLIDWGLAFLAGKFTNRVGQSFLPSKPGAETSEEKGADNAL